MSVLYYIFLSIYKKRQMHVADILRCNSLFIGCWVLLAPNTTMRLNDMSCDADVEIARIRYRTPGEITKSCILQKPRVVMDGSRRVCYTGLLIPEVSDADCANTYYGIPIHRGHGVWDVSIFSKTALPPFSNLSRPPLNLNMEYLQEIRNFTANINTQ